MEFDTLASYASSTFAADVGYSASALWHWATTSLVHAPSLLIFAVIVNNLMWIVFGMGLLITGTVVWRIFTAWYDI